MKTAAIIQAAALVATAAALVATSRAPCQVSPPDTQLFSVDGDCGPTGIISVTSNASCVLTVTAGRPVFMPHAGSLPLEGPIRGQAIVLSGFVLAPDGGTISGVDGGERPPADLQQAGGCIGAPCERGNWRTCAGATVDDAGVVSLTCTTDNGPVFDSCSARLTPIP